MSEWKKVKIGDICKIVKGTTGIASAEPGKYPLVVTAEERKTCSTYQFDCEAVCIPLVSSSGHGKKSLKNVHYQSGKFALGTILCAVIPNNSQELDACYLHQYLQFYKDIILVPLMKGAANVSLSMKDIATVEFPLPPIERQRELSNLFVSLHDKQKELSAEYEKQTEYAKLLRQSILQQAIEGKFTADWRKQNPVQKGNPCYDAEELFEQIQKERTNKKKQKELSPIKDEEKSFEIPEGWKWVRLGEIANIARGGSPRPIEQYITQREDGLNWIMIGDTQKDSKYITSTAKKIDPSGLYKTRMVHKGDFILSNSMSFGRPYILEIDGCIHDGWLVLTGGIIFINKDYMYNVLSSSFVYRQFSSIVTGGIVKNLNSDKVSITIIPLPPLKEQEEIVNKIESLLAKVTTLENQIQDRKTLSEKLTFGIIKEKLEG